MELEKFLKTNRLAARAHGLLFTHMDRITEGLAKVINDHMPIFRRLKNKQHEALLAELPILILILVLQESERSDQYPQDEMAEVFKSGLINFFATNYIALYQDMKDPIKETLARVDWYLDGQEGSPQELFARYAAGMIEGPKDDISPILLDFIDETIMPEVHKALDLAPRYRI